MALPSNIQKPALKVAFPLKIPQPQGKPLQPVPSKETPSAILTPSSPSPAKAPPYQRPIPPPAHSSRAQGCSRWLDCSTSAEREFLSAGLFATARYSTSRTTASPPSRPRQNPIASGHGPNRLAHAQARD